MNIPVVATMPMAGMMPLQQQSGGQQQQGSAVTGSNVGAATAASVGQQPLQGQTGGGAGNNEPNAQGVKSFSIKL